jgi:metallo-beta-lactamase class B
LTAEGKATPFPKVVQVRAVADGETLHVGDLAITAHLTPGHTPGSTSWTWDSCAHEACLHLAYVDSLNALDYKLIDNPAYPAIAQDFLHSFDVVAALPCDIVLSPHPGVVDMWKKLDRRQRKSVPDPFVDADACRNYARMFREDFEKKLARQQTSTP